MKVSERKWWHDKVIYEIYSKSFCDSNGDGIGDLGGILQKMDYLEKLGADILWLCPCFRSPFVDQGYDISDYYEIDPVFGTNRQMEEILAEAKKRGMSVILDLVANHCSAEHFWFQEAIKDPEGKYGKYFYIVDAAEDEMPTNWRSYFGGHVWSPLPGKPGKSTLLMTQRIYFYGFTAHDYGRGSAIAVMLTLIIVIISLIQLVILRRREDIY